MKEKFGMNGVQFYSGKIKAAISLWLMLSSANRMGSAIVVVDHEKSSSLRTGMLGCILACKLQVCEFRGMKVWPEDGVISSLCKSGPNEGWL